MKGKFLFPGYLKTTGWLMAVSGCILGYFVVYHNFTLGQLAFKISENSEFLRSPVENFTNETAIALTITGFLLVAFSREKTEDELITKLRLDSLYWAVLINYLGIIVILLTKINFIDIYVFNLFTPLLICIIRFYYLLYFKKNSYIISEVRFLPHFPFRKIAISGTAVCALAILITYSDYKLPQWLEGWSFWLHISFVTFLLVWAYSRNIKEDELTTQYRVESMQLAVLINSVLLLIADFLAYSLTFYIVMFSNIFFLLLLFIIRFTYVCNKGESVVKKGLLS